MIHQDKSENGPLVSILVPTFNRPLYLAKALESAVRQGYRNLQIIVVNDGGCDVTGIVESFNDQRITFINRKLNRGKAYSLNEAIARVKGKYVAYLDDDDILYSNHVETLVDTLENNADYGAAYSDLYKVYCRQSPDGQRVVLSKVVDVSRDFDRFLMLFFNHVLHVSCLHRLDLFEKTGLYNDKLNILIDWDMTRRLSFFTDFYHVHQVTGEFYHPAGECDRISVQRRKDKEDYARNVVTIRTTRPAKPWPKIADLSIIFTVERLDQQSAATMGLIWRHTFYPYKLYLALSQEDISRFTTEMPGIVIVPVDSASTQLQRIDRVLAECEGQYIAVVGSGFPIRDMWLEDSLYALINTPNKNEAFELEGSRHDLWAVVARKEHLQIARNRHPDLPVREGFLSGGITVRRLKSDEIPFQFDCALKEAQKNEGIGDWKQAFKIYEHIEQRYHNHLWMKSSAANALFKAGDFVKSAEIISWVNRQRQTVDTLLLEAKLKRRSQDFVGALSLLTKAEDILTGRTQSDTNTQATEKSYVKSV